MCMLRSQRTFNTVESIDGIALSDSMWMGVPGGSGFYRHTQGVTLFPGGSKNDWGAGYDAYDGIRFVPGAHEIVFSSYEGGGVTTKVDLQALSWGSNPTAGTGAWRSFKEKGDVTGTQVTTAIAAGQVLDAIKTEIGPLGAKHLYKFKFEALPGHEYSYHWKEKRINDDTIGAWVDCELIDERVPADSPALPAE